MGSCSTTSIRASGFLLIENRTLNRRLEKDLELIFSTPEEVANETSGEEGEVPEIVIEPTGEITPFQIDIRHSDSLVTTSIETDGLAKVAHKFDELAQL